MWASLILYSLLISLVLYGERKGRILERLGYKKVDNLAAAAFQGTTLLFLMLIVSMIIGIFFTFTGMQDNAVSQVIKSADPASLILVVLVGSFVEEIFFRGYLQRKTNILTASFIFAYFHVIYGSLPEMVGAFALGFMLGKAYEKTNNIFVPTFAHVLYNLVIVYISLVL